MKKILRNIIRSIADFLNRIADKQAETVIEFYGQVFESNQNKGGDR